MTPPSYDLCQLVGKLFDWSCTGNTADSRIAGACKVCVHSHYKTTDVSIGIVKSKPKFWKEGKSKVVRYVITMDHSHPSWVLIVLHSAVSELVHIHRGSLTVNVSDLVTRCKVDVITEKVYKLRSQCISITVVWPWDVHELQGVCDEVSELYSRKYILMLLLDH